MKRLLLVGALAGTSRPDKHVERPFAREVDIDKPCVHHPHDPDSHLVRTQCEASGSIVLGPAFDARSSFLSLRSQTPWPFILVEHETVLAGVARVGFGMLAGSKEGPRSVAGSAEMLGLMRKIDWQNRVISALKGF
jgi:hypothetical protein